VSFASSIKRYVPKPLQPYLRRLKRAVLGQQALSYEARIKSELNVFTATEHVHDLPAIMHYWSGKFLVPIVQQFGFGNSIEMFRIYIARVCAQHPQETCRVVSLASGDSASEINVAEWLLEQNVRNFRIECLDLNEEVLSRGRRSAEVKGIREFFEFNVADVNSWEPRTNYHVVLAIQCLHHVVKLEQLFDTIHKVLNPSGFFLTDDMIGRNGHRLWPEALKHVSRLWEELPKSHRFNHSTKTLDRKPDDVDYSEGCFEGIRAQDILPLLVKRFHFEVFVGFANIVDVFVDRRYGPNFDPSREWDRAFIDRVHALDIQEIDAGRVKPTHMYAAMTRTPVELPKFHRHWSPEFCIRTSVNKRLRGAL
jgi:ubiquinone/menaquinone biosynthesis C-methylase UbiE